MRNLSTVFFVSYIQFMNTAENQPHFLLVFTCIILKNGQSLFLKQQLPVWHTQQ